MKEVRKLLPNEDLLYYADSGYCPYGEKSPELIIERSREITKFLLAQEAKIIVVACNTASVTALETLRKEFPGVSFVGVEPAVKQAALFTKNRRVGVLATGVTLAGQRFSTLVERFAENLTILTQPCPGLVEKVEAGEIAGGETEALLHSYLDPLLQRQVDVVVLGCTHYPFLRPLVEKAAGPGVTVLDTGEPVARQTLRVLTAHDLLSPSAERGREWFFTSGDRDLVGPVISRLWGGLGEGLSDSPFTDTELGTDDIQQQ